MGSGHLYINGTSRKKTKTVLRSASGAAIPHGSMEMMCSMHEKWLSYSEDQRFHVARRSAGGFTPTLRQ